MGNNVSKNKDRKKSLSKNINLESKSMEEEVRSARLKYIVNGAKTYLFNPSFVEKNKNKCKIIIYGKEREIFDKISSKDLKKYIIKKNDKTFDVILKGEAIEDMSSMFNSCKNLIKADFSSFKCQNVKNMSGMFAFCKNLNEVDFTSFNTKNVTNMKGMFLDCWNLTKVDLSSFDTRHVINMIGMFNDCWNLTKVDLSSFNTRHVTSMKGMFSGCHRLTKIDLSSFNTRKVENVSDMLCGCTSLNEIILSPFDIKILKVLYISPRRFDRSQFLSLIKIKSNRKHFIRNRSLVQKIKLFIIEI